MWGHSRQGSHAEDALAELIYANTLVLRHPASKTVGNNVFFFFPLSGLQNFITIGLRLSARSSRDGEIENLGDW